ncbi:hypothetical protein [Siminovitchia sp. 179-K 8D1 HS]
MIKKYNFIFKGKLMDISASSFKEAEILAEQLFKELENLEMKA